MAYLHTVCDLQIYLKQLLQFLILVYAEGRRVYGYA